MVEQKVVKIVWQDPADPPQQNATAVAIGDYGGLIEDLWTKHKLINKEYKEATPEQKDARARSLQRQTNLIHVAVDATNKYGADSILDNMGKNQKLTIILLNFVRYCYTAKDYTGPAPKSVLQLISHFTTLTTEFLGRLKLGQLRTKYLKEVDTETRELLDQIFDNAKEHDKQQPQPPTDNQDNKKSSKTATPSAPPTAKEMPAPSKLQTLKKEPGLKSATSDAKRMQPIKYAGLESARKVSNGTAGTSTKRARDDDIDSRYSKKMAVEGTTGAVAANKQPSTTTTSSSAPQPAITTTYMRPKPSVSILPGKSRPVVKPVVKKTEPQRSVLGSLLEEIAKPKETPKPREEPEGPPETPEERDRRLRKESRRGKRVTWASEDKLLKYHYFQHDSAEDEGRARNQLRDARDNRSEGQMLKLLARGKKDKEDGEESEDDEEDVKETSLKDWKDPAISERTLSQDRLEKNFERRGGSQKTDTQQQKFINEYESRELMSIYTTTTEIPITPRSPPQKTAAEPLSQPSVVPTLSSPKARESYLRALESRKIGSFSATQMAIKRLPIAYNINSSQNSTLPVLSQSTSPTNPSQAHSLAPMMTQDQRDAEVLALLNSKRVTEWVDPNPYNPAQRHYDYPHPKVQGAANSLELIVEQYKDKVFPPTEPPKWLQDNPDRVKEWWNGYNANVAKARNAKSAAPASYPPFPVSQPVQQQQLQQQPQPQQDASSYATILHQIQAIQANQASQQQAAVQPQASATPDIQSLLKTLSQSTLATQAQAPAAAAATQSVTAYNADANAAAWMAYYAQFQNQGQVAYQQQQQQQQQQPAAPAYGTEANAAQWAAYYQQYQNQAQSQSQAQSQAQGQAQGQESAYGQEYQPDSDQNGRRDRDRRSNNRPHGSSNNNNNNGNNSNAGSNNRSGVDRDSRGINRSLIGTKPCTFWAKNQCTKGDKCTFRHDPADLVNANY